MRLAGALLLASSLAVTALGAAAAPGCGSRLDRGIGQDDANGGGTRDATSPVESDAADGASDAAGRVEAALVDGATGVTPPAEAAIADARMDASTAEAATTDGSACVDAALCPHDCSNNWMCCPGSVCAAQPYRQCLLVAGECCRAPTDCLSGSCAGGQCACSPGGGGCNSGADCCDGVSCFGASDAEPGTCCNGAGRTCASGAECCSGSCTAGRCDCQASLPTGGWGNCTVNADCCNGNCLTGALGWGSCEPLGLDGGCVSDNDCRFHYCLNGRCSCKNPGQDSDPSTTSAARAARPAFPPRVVAPRRAYSA
jgi:hypothetical protein